MLLKSSFTRVAVAALMLFGSAHIRNRAQSFQIGESIDVPIHPNAVAIGDFNEDGTPDVAIPCWSPNDLVIALGVGDGRLGSLQAFGLGGASGPRFVVVADFNRDGHLDAATANSDTADISVLLGNGTGSLAFLRRVRTASTPFHLATGDLNKDGITDLVVANSGAGSISTLIGDGTGNFTVTATVQSGGAASSTPRCVRVADFNGDTDPDIAVSNYGSGSVSLFMGNGAGNLGSPIHFSVGTNPFTAAAGDLNNDGRSDLAVPNYGSGTVSLLLSDAVAGFVNGGIIPVGKSPRAVIAEDFDGDGSLDLAVANYDNNTVSMLRGNGVGQFVKVADFGSGMGPFSLVAWDMDGDGFKDILTADRDGHTVSVLRGLNAELLAPKVFSVGNNPRGIAMGDFNGDGRIDLAVANNVSATVSVLLGDGAGSFAAGPTLAAAAGTWGVTVVDINGDGNADIVTANSSNNSVSAFRGNGLGGFAPQQKWNLTAGPRAVIAADLNGDGRLDLATANFNGSVSVLIQNSAGSFPPAVSYATGAGSTGLAAGDLDGDGDLDLAVCNATAGTVTSLLGNGNGTFASGGSVASGAAPAGIIAGNFNADAHLDVAVANETANTLTVLHGNGAGGFSTSFTAETDLRPLGIDAGDLNGDGLADLVVAAATSESLTVYKANGDGTFAFVNSLPAGAFARALKIADLDGDGQRDIVVANANGNDVWALLNRTGAGGPVNEAPVADAQAVSVTEDGSIAILLTGSDPEGAALTFSIQQQPGHGVLSGTPPNVTYTPTANYFGSDSFTFRVSDGVRSATAVISITVEPANDAPVASPIEVSTSEEQAVGVGLAGSDVDGDTLSYEILTQPAHGTLAGTAPSLTYTPAADYTGQDSFTYHVFDGTAYSAPATVTIQVNAFNDTPTVVSPIPDQSAGEEALAITVDLAGRFDDAETAPESLVLSVVSADPDLVAPSIAGTQLNLDLNPNRGGTTTITVRATDEGGAFVEDSFIVTVTRAGARISVADASYGEGGSVVFTISLSAASDQPVTVAYHTEDSTAVGSVDYTPVSGTVVFAPGVLTRTVSVPTVADILDEDNEAFRLVLESPVGAALNDAEGIGTILDNDTSRLRVSDVSVTEGDAGSTYATFLVTLSTPSARDVTVNYATVNSTSGALAGLDYVSTAGTLVFPAGSSQSLSVQVEILGDLLDEADQSFSFLLSDPANAVIDRGTARGTILDNDVPPLVSVADVSISEGNSGTKTLMFTVSLTSASEFRTRVRYTTLDDQAIAGLDYVARNGELVFDPGVTVRNIAVSVSGDVVAEADETFRLQLHTPTALTISDDEAIATILNDD